MRKSRMKSVTETFFRKGKAVRQEMTRRFATFEEAARGLQYGKVTETEHEDGSITVARTESRRAE